MQQRVVEDVWSKGVVFGLKAGAISGGSLGLLIVIVGSVFGLFIGAWVGLILGFVQTAVIVALSRIPWLRRDQFVTVAYVICITIVTSPMVAVMSSASAENIKPDEWLILLAMTGLPTAAGIISTILGLRKLIVVERVPSYIVSV